MRRRIQYRLLCIWQCRNPSQRHAVVGKTVESWCLFQPKPQKKTEAAVFGSHEHTCLAFLSPFMCSSLLFNRWDITDLMSHGDLRGAWLQLEMEPLLWAGCKERERCCYWFWNESFTPADWDGSSWWKKHHGNKIHRGSTWKRIPEAKHQQISVVCCKPDLINMALL